MNRRNLFKYASLLIFPTLSGLAVGQNSALQYKVFTATRPGLSRDLPPGRESLAWVANSSTLIFGRQDAVLIDTFLTIEQTTKLADEIVATGKSLRTIYVTHAHSDHFLSLRVLQDRFPNATAIASPEVVAQMRIQTTPEKLDGRLRKLFPNQIPAEISIPEAFNGDRIELEGKSLLIVKLGHTDTDNSTCVFVPSTGLVVAGDAVYNEIHPFLNESNPSNRLEWIAALDKIDALNPSAVVAGHKVPSNDDSPQNIEKTRQYIRDFIRLNNETKTARELYDAMLELYPNRANPGSLWASANAAKVGA